MLIHLFTFGRQGGDKESGVEVSGSAHVRILIVL